MVRRLVTVAVLAASVVAEEPCCQNACKDQGKEKYWSIAKSTFGTPHCGECCMDPKKYDLYHFFEKNLTHSDSETPCHDFGYNKYDSTVTHGFGPVTMTLDLYDFPSETPDEIEEAACCEGKCQDAGKDKYWSIAKSMFGIPHCGETCIAPKDYKLYHFFEPNLTKSDSNTPCHDFGYAKYDSTVTHGAGPVKVTLDLYDLPKPEAQAKSANLILDDNTNVTIHKIDYPVKGNCGQFDMPAKAAHFPVSFGGFKMGGCSVDGYTVANGTKHECSPQVVGKQWCADFELFAKPQHFEANLKAAEEACCKGKCQEPGQEKYWSIAKSTFGKPHCGECCMDPSKYNLYHIFEKNLTKSDSDTPCTEFGYLNYDSTVTHGFGPVKMTLDLYDLPKAEPSSELLAPEAEPASEIMV